MQAGIVAQTYDDDWFTFMAGDGRISFQVGVADVNPNLDVKLELWREVRDYGGRTYVEQVSVEDPRFMLSANMACEVTAGKYYLLVTSHGEYGDVGQFTLTGQIPQHFVPTYEFGFSPGMFLRPEVFAQPFASEPLGKEYQAVSFVKSEAAQVDSWTGLKLKSPEYVVSDAPVKSFNPEYRAASEMKSYELAVDLVMATDLGKGLGG